MENYNKNLCPHLKGLESALQTDSGQFTLDTIQQTQERLHSIIHQLCKIRNSYLPINKLNPDILYNIFYMAVRDSDSPDLTVIMISQVCRRWRNSLLGWPALWTFVDLSLPLSIADLLIRRSENAPLDLSWKDAYDCSLKSFFESRADLILPRLRSLDLHLSDQEFLQIQPVFQDYQRQPLRLRYLDIHITPLSMFSPSITPPSMDALRIDISYLRQLKLEGVNLPRLAKLSETKLTHFTLRFPRNFPSFSQLVTILGSSPLLRRIELGVDQSPSADLDASVCSIICLHNLERLVLISEDTTIPSSDYLRRLSNCIQTSNPLFQFDLLYIRTQGVELLQSFLRPVTPSILSHFSGHHYLSIKIEIHTSYSGVFHIASAPEYLNDRVRRWTRSSYPLCLSGSCPPALLFDHRLILDVIYALPRITHLNIYHVELETTTPWNIDARRALPNLDTLELFGDHWQCADDYLAKMLDSLPMGLELKRLTIGRIGRISPDAVLDMISKTAVEVLELEDDYYNDEESFGEVIVVLRKKGVMVIPHDRYFIHVS